MVKKRLTAQQMTNLQANLAKKQPIMNDDQISGNEGDRRLNSGIFGEIFDKLSRTSAASAGGVHALTDKDDSTGFGSGVMQGLTGKTHHNYGEVLGNLGVTNPIARGIGGFVGDVALDPLTYAGVKATKGVRTQSAIIRGMKETAEAGIEEGFEDVATRAARRIEAENPSTLQLTMFGKKVSPAVTGPSRLGNYLRDKIAGPELERNWLARGVSREAQLPAGLNEMSRRQDLLSASEFNSHQDMLLKVGDELTPDQSRRVLLALEEGEDLSAVPLELSGSHLSENGMQNLGDYQKMSRNLFDKWWDDDVALGVRTPDQKVENYVPKYLNKPPAPRYPGTPAGSKNKQGGIKDITKERSLRELEADGYEPNFNLGDVLRQRAAANYRHVGRAKTVIEPIEKMGIVMNDANNEMLTKRGWISVAENISNPVAKTGRYDGHFLPEPIVRAINQMEEVATDDSVASNLVKFYDKSILHPWKAATTMTPGKIVRDSFGDAIMNMADGVKSPLPYAQAAKVLKGARERHTTSLLDETMGRVGTPEAKFVDANKTIRVGGQNISTDAFYDLSLKAGVDVGPIAAIERELTPEAQAGLGHYRDRAATALNPIAGAKDLAHGFLSVGRMREKYFRTAHLIDKTSKLMKKNKNLSLEDAVMQAGQDVRHWNIDYGNLSTTEQKLMRRVMPFYSWFRRNAPVQLELLFTKPGFMALYPKGQDLTQTIFSADNGEGDFMVSKWMRELAPVRLAMANNEGNVLNRIARRAAGAGAGDAVYAPLLSGMTPIGDIKTLTEPLQAASENGSIAERFIRAGTAGAKVGVNMGTPAIKAPFELATGRSTFTGAEMKTPGDWGKWAASQVGAPGAVTNMAAGDFQEHRALSMGTGLQLQANTAKRQKGENTRRNEVYAARIRHLKIEDLKARGKEVNEKNIKRTHTKRTRQLEQYVSKSRKATTRNVEGI